MLNSLACLQKLVLCDASKALNFQLHVHRARMGAQSFAGRVLANLFSRDRIAQYYLAGRDGHQIHPRRVDWIDSVKINPGNDEGMTCAPPKTYQSNPQILEERVGPFSFIKSMFS